MTRDLPTWAQTPAAQRLINAVLADKPDYFTRTYPDEPYSPDIRYKGKAMAALRKYHRSLIEDANSQADAAFAAGTPWSEAGAALNALFAQEEPDELIDRLLVSLTVCVGDPMLNLDKRRAA